MKALILGNGGISKGFQEVFKEKGIDFDIYYRDMGDLYELSQKINQIYDLIIYAIGDIVYKRIKNLTVEDIEQVFKPNIFGFIVLTSILPQILNNEGKVVVLGANLGRVALPNLSVYASSKSALKTFVEIAKKEMRSYTFYLLEPNEVDTPIWNKVPFKPQNPQSPREFALEVIDQIGLSI